MVEGQETGFSVGRDVLGDDPVVRDCLVEGVGFRVTELVCHEDRRSFRPTIVRGVPDTPVLLVLFVRSGGFLLRAGGREEFIDPAMGFVICQGDEAAVSHPVRTCDVSTLLEIGQGVHDSVSAPRAPQGMPVAAGLDLAHRSLVAACRAGVDPSEALERVCDLLARLSGGPFPDASGRRASTVLAHRRIVHQIRAALIEGPLTMGLEELSRQVGCSPFHVSRIFRWVTGQTLTGYRNLLRVRAVAEEIAEGQPLRVLAAKYGFADQAHMTRVFRRHAGAVPSSVRDLLQPAGAVHRN
ncbi:helix-turn-helix transcriptional regulator [Streptomyces hesseae]|uniref:AraC family transcriptional regulator n=1 Tax=Streptomyces hesseae TaxID=3075519 RepID=A0ABU2SXU8_9ACTN|nr:AraC family transcriptional regulator [Streptomyces sp. DSM 40473]MDT0453640.1 AraC family transcriptional regulator [Streptomyces sp. DSM 40473]